MHVSWNKRLLCLLCMVRYHPLMPTIEEYVQRAEECERLAATCLSQANREILQRAAAQWRMMAEQAAAREALTHTASPRVPTSVDPGKNGKG
jgi:hypothetical protein